MGLKERIEWRAARLLGQKVASLDILANGAMYYMVTAHWRGHLYVLREGVVQPGDCIELPLGCEIRQTK